MTMADKQIKFTVTADDNPFAAGMKRVGEALAGVQQRFGATGRNFKLTADAISAQMRNVTNSVRTEVAGMGGHFSGLLESVGATRLGFVALVGAAGALAASKAVTATAEMTEQAMDLARVLGSSTNEAQAWRIALQDVGAQQGDLEAASKGMARQLKENEAEMQAMGLQTRDATGQLRPMTDLLQEGIGIVNQHKEGFDRALAAQQLFGRGVDASSKLLLVQQGTLDEARQTMQELGLEVGANAVAAWKEYDAATDRAGFSLKGLGNTVGSVLMPIFTDLINAFNAVMPAAITVVRGALGGLTTAFHGVKNGVVVVWETINAFVVSVAEPVRAVVEAVGRAMVGDFRGAADAIKGVPTVITTAWTQAMDRIAESSQRTHDRIGAIWNADSAPGQPEGANGTKTYTAPRKAEKRQSQGKADFVGPQLADAGYYEQMLEREKLLSAQQDALREYGKAQELAYWRDVLQGAELAGKDRVAIQRKVVDLEIQILRDQAREQQALDAERIKGRQQAALDAVEMARLEATAQVEQGAITQEQLLELERQFEMQRTEIQREALLQRLALIDPTRDPVAYEQISQQIEELERQHQLRLRQIQIEQAAAVQANNPLAAVWDGARNAMEQSISAMLQRTQTLRQGLASIWQGIRSTVAGEIAKIVVAKAAAFVKERALAIAGIGSDAAKAGAGAAASQASIPYVGPALALAAMAAVSGAVLALGGGIPSARGGWDIPAGVNPITQLHEREMVLPQGPADVIRGLAEQGGAGRAGNVSVEIQATPMPGNFFMVHKDALVQALRSAQRDGFFR
jgi:hypothetical protein